MNIEKNLILELPGGQGIPISWKRPYHVFITALMAPQRPAIFHKKTQFCSLFYVIRYIILILIEYDSKVFRPRDNIILCCVSGRVIQSVFSPR